jgi:hypothetical protein
MRYASGVIIGRELVGSEEWAVYVGENELIAVDGVLRASSIATGFGGRHVLSLFV